MTNNTIPLTDAEIAALREANNINVNFPNAVAVKTAIGGVVFVDPKRTDIIALYKNGQLTGVEDAAAPGVILRGLPNIALPSVSANITTTEQFVQTQTVSIPPLDGSVKTLPLIITISEQDALPSEKVLPLSINIAAYDVVEVPLRSALLEVLTTEVSSKVSQYFDRDRFLKTLLNFGEDTQRIITNWKLDPNDATKLLVKLLSPLDFQFDVGNNVFLSREVANSIIDTVKFELLPQPDTSLWLRPKNTSPASFITDTELLNIYNHTISNQTLTTAGINLTGSGDNYGGYTFENNILRKWYTDDYRSAELNVDYTNYANFITYSSAELRLQAFKQKLTKIRELENSSRFIAGLASSSIFGNDATIIDTNVFITTNTTYASPVLITDSGSLTIDTGSIVTIYSPDEIPSASAYLVEGAKTSALEIENIIRGFDGYERYLFYESGSAYSASVYWQLNGTEYHVDGTWPKRDTEGNLYPPTSAEAIAWYDQQVAIAQRYDENNPNLLSNAIPSYLLDDINSQEFIKFTKLIGHFFDNVKIYVDHLPRIYDRQVTATAGLSQDLVWDVAKSFGLSLTNPNAAASLYSFTTDTSLTKKREQTTELWKRFLHNAPYLNRTRGTANALKALLNIFGLNEQVVGIRETDTTTTGSFEIFDEITNALNFNTGSYLVLPMSSSKRPVGTLQFRFNNATRVNTTLGVGDTAVPSGSWVVSLVTHPSASSPYGRIEVTNNIGGILLSSSYADMFDTEDYFDVMLRYDSSSMNLQVAQSDGEQILYSSSMSTTGSYLLDAWPATKNFYLGGSGSLSTNNFNGYIDEVRVWGEQINNNIFKAQVLDPGSFVGNNYTSPVESLWVRLSFHTPRNLVSGSIPNESPYRNKDGVSDPSLPLLPNLVNIIAVGFQNQSVYPYSMTRVSRKVRQYTTNAGAYSYGSNKIIIAPPPVFTEVTPGGELMLHKDRSIVDNKSRKQQQQTKNYLGFFVSPTDAVNNLLIRALGNVDIKRRVGYGPRYKSRYADIEALQNYYKQYYNATVNIPQFVRFFDKLAPTLFEQSSQLVPAKTILQTGIVIEPNILERKKLTAEKPLKLSGANTRRNQKFASTERTYVRDFDITLSTEVTLPSASGLVKQTAYFTDYSARFDINASTVTTGDANLTLNAQLNTVQPTGSALYSTYNANTLHVTQSMPMGEIFTGLLDGVTIETPGGQVKGDFNYYDGDGYKLNELQSVSSQLELFDSDIEKLSYITYLRTYAGLSLREAEQLAIGYKPGNIIDIGNLIGVNDSISQANIINVIPPRSDLEDYSVANYYIKSNGIYYFETVYKEIVGKNQLNFLTGTQATWSFGSTYNRNDVVVQYDAPSGSAKTSNGKLFRYIAQDAPSVSYNYPALDKNRWAPVFYTGKAVQTPYRIIFDVNKASGNESVFELPTTRVSISRPIVEPKRYSTKLTLGSVAANSRTTGLIRLQSLATLFSVNVGVSTTPTPAIRVRLYDSANARDADLNRVFGIEPLDNHGVLLDIKLENDSVNKNVGLYPPVTIINNDEGSTSSPVIYYTIDEVAGNTYNNGFIVTFNYFAIEAPIQLPVGYLPRHYRFYRDNLLATKRRNYIGCLQTQNTTTDGRSPVEVTFTAGTTLTVSPNVLQQEESLGGINLNVN
jgi:hypothetical protein